MLSSGAALQPKGRKCRWFANSGNTTTQQQNNNSLVNACCFSPLPFRQQTDVPKRPPPLAPASASEHLPIYKKSSRLKYRSTTLAASHPPSPNTARSISPLHSRTCTQVHWCCSTTLPGGRTDSAVVPISLTPPQQPKGTSCHIAPVLHTHVPCLIRCRQTVHQQRQ